MMLMCDVCTNINLDVDVKGNTNIKHKLYKHKLYNLMCTNMNMMCTNIKHKLYKHKLYNLMCTNMNMMCTNQYVDVDVYTPIC